MKKFTRSSMWGVLLILLGVFMLLNTYFHIRIPFFPIILILLGVSFFLPKE